MVDGFIKITVFSKQLHTLAKPPNLTCMGQFNVTQIKYEGDVKAQTVVGQHGHTTNIVPKVEKQDETTARIFISTNFEHTANGEVLYYIRVNSLFTLFNIDLKNLDREKLLLTSMIIKSFSHLQGIIAAKYQEQKIPSGVPFDPDYRPFIETIQRQFLSVFRK